MRKCWNKLLAITVISLTISLAGLVMSGPALAQQCVDNENGTVTDNSTGLMWQYHTAGPMNWADAMNYVSIFLLGGHSDWRLPENVELVGLYNSSCKAKMNVKLAAYWSATSRAINTDYAWLVHFAHDYVSNDAKSNSYYVRAVRAGQ